MSKVPFTNEQLELLRSNPYTQYVTPHTLSFTQEFRDVFHAEYQSGRIPREILERHGYPIAVLGKHRLWGIAYYMKKDLPAELPVREKRHAGGEADETAAELVRLRQEICALRQEVERIGALVEHSHAGEGKAADRTGPASA